MRRGNSHYGHVIHRPWWRYHPGWIVFFLAASAFFLMLGSRGLNEPDEGRYASVASHMADSGNWLLPQLEGRHHLTKPPLTYWLMATAITAFGYNEWAVRLPSALAALGTVLLTFSLAMRWIGRRRALFAALLLTFSPLFFIMARLADPNMLLTLWTLFGIWLWSRWRGDQRGWQQALFYLSLSLSFLTKGPIGPAMTLSAIALFSWYVPAPAASRSIGSWTGALLAIVLGLSWHLWMVWQDASLLDYFINDELVDRLASKDLYRNQPIWFYPAVMAGAFLPWLPWLWKGARLAVAGNTPRRNIMRASAAFVVIWLVALTLMKSKQATYPVPLFPVIAIFIASAMPGMGWTCVQRRRVWIVPLILAIVLPAFITVYGAVRYKWEMNWPLAGATWTSLMVIMLVIWRWRWPVILRMSLAMLVSYASILVLQLQFEDKLTSKTTCRSFIHDVQRVTGHVPATYYFTSLPRSWDFYYRGDYALVKMDHIEEAPSRAREYSGANPLFLIVTKHQVSVLSDLAGKPLNPLVSDRKFVLLSATNVTTGWADDKK